MKNILMTVGIFALLPWALPAMLAVGLGLSLLAYWQAPLIYIAVMIYVAKRIKT